MAPYAVRVRRHGPSVVYDCFADKMLRAGRRHAVTVRRVSGTASVAYSHRVRHEFLIVIIRKFHGRRNETEQIVGGFHFERAHILYAVRYFLYSLAGSSYGIDEQRPLKAEPRRKRERVNAEFILYGGDRRPDVQNRKNYVQFYGAAAGDEEVILRLISVLRFSSTDVLRTGEYRSRIKNAALRHIHKVGVVGIAARPCRTVVAGRRYFRYVRAHDKPFASVRERRDVSVGIRHCFKRCAVVCKSRHVCPRRIADFGYPP